MARHIVKEGERLSAIAALHGVPPEAIVQANAHKPAALLPSGARVFASLAAGEDIAIPEPGTLGWPWTECPDGFEKNWMSPGCTPTVVADVDYVLGAASECADAGPNAHVRMLPGSMLPGTQAGVPLVNACVCPKECWTGVTCKCSGPAGSDDGGAGRNVITAPPTDGSSGGGDASTPPGGAPPVVQSPLPAGAYCPISVAVYTTAGTCVWADEKGNNQSSDPQCTDPAYIWDKDQRACLQSPPSVTHGAAPDEPAEDHKVRNFIIGFIIGIPTGLGLAYLTRDKGR